MERELQRRQDHRSLSCMPRGGGKHRRQLAAWQGASKWFFEILNPSQWPTVATDSAQTNE